MMDFILVPLVVGIATLGIYKLFELFVCRKERIIMIEKLGDKLSSNDINSKFSFNVNYSRSQFSFSALKAGCLMMGIGLGLLFAFFICCCAFPYYTTGRDAAWNVQQQASLVYGACVLCFGGIGLLTAFLIEMNMKKKENKENKEKE